MNGGHIVTRRSSVTVLAVAVVLFALSSGDWLPELAALIATGLAAVLAAAGVLFFAVWLTQRRETGDFGGRRGRLL